MKILFVADVSSEEILGGAERVLYEQTKRLAERGHEVHILTRRLESHRNDSAVLGKVREWRYELDRSSSFSFIRSTLRNGRRLFEKLSEKHQLDCLNFHQPFSAFAVLRSVLAKGIKKVYTCHSLAFEEYASRNPRPPFLLGKLHRSLTIAAMKWLEGRVLGQVDRIVVLSRYTQDKLRKKYRIPPERIVIIPGGIDLERFRPPADKRALREELRLPQEGIVLLTVRNLVPRMGLENLVSAMEEVAKVLPEALLLIGGSGPLREALEERVRSLSLSRHIRFVGYIPEEILPQYYQAADLFILPTADLEGFGLVTLEALASGLPVLGTPVGATKGLLGGLDPRFLFADASAGAISRLVIEFGRVYKEDPRKWQEDSLRCRRFVEENYSWERNVAATERLFYQLLEK